MNIHLRRLCCPATFIIIIVVILSEMIVTGGPAAAAGFQKRPGTAALYGLEQLEFHAPPCHSSQD